MHDAVIISDLHLGSHNCQAKKLCDLLEDLHDERIPTERLILNGDVFDSIDFRRLNKHHWKVLSLFRKLSDEMEILWLCGNHDGPAEIVSHLLGVRVLDEYILETGGRRLLILHGHTFDEFLDAHPILTWIGDCIYWGLQSLDTTHTMARRAKHSSKTFLRCAQRIEDKSMEYARKKGCDAVCCGHTHHAVTRQTPYVHYYNSGCWTELPCTYLTVSDGEVLTRHYEAAEPAGLESTTEAAETTVR